MAEIKQFYSQNFDPIKRKKENIKYVVFHYTGMKSEKSALKKLSDNKSKVSCHYFIKKNGSIINLVPDLYVSWHAGISNWKKLKNLNKFSIGIEIHNAGHQFRYNSFNKKQINSIKYLSLKLAKKYNFKREHYLGHSDIASDRKKDPGEKFPWEKLAKKGLVWFHNLDSKKIKKFRKTKLSSKFEENIFISNLYKIGYKKIKGYKFNKNMEYLTKAFQRRFRRDLVDGKIDKECLTISKNLISH